MLGYGAIRRLALTSLVAAFSAAYARQPEIAARPLGMGEAFLATADDGNTLVWNPAGLPWLDHHEVIGSRADPFDIGIHAANLGYALPLTDDLVAGFDWNNLRSDDTGLGYDKNSFRLSCGYRVWRRFSLGLGVRRVQMDMSLDGLSLASGSGWGVDLAALYAPLKRCNLALVVRDLTDTEVRYEDRSKGEVARRRIRVGAAYKPTAELTLAADVTDRFHFGTEYWYENTLALRAGFHRDLDTSDPPTYAAGVSIRHQFFQFDYAFVMPPSLPASSRFSFSLFFNLYPAKVRILEQPRISPIFPAFARRYAGLQPLGQVKIGNQDDQPHRATLSFYIPELMNAPAKKQFVILPKETREIAVDTVLFSSRIAQLTEPRLTQALIEVSYTAQQRTRTHRRQAHLFVYGHNHTQWDDVRKAAAFITPRDPVVEDFSRPLLADFEPEIISLGKASRILMRAMVLFEAVKEHGVRYTPDANNPYDQMSADADAVDHIQYPAELLHNKTGDCDDLAVLYCALLENAGVHTALVDFPGHIFMMFDTGITYPDVYKLPIDRSLYVVRGDRLWIPVEITLFGQSFLAAWRVAADELAALAVRERQRLVVDTADSWAAYEPSPPPFERGITPPARGDFHERFLEQYAAIENMMADFISHTYVEYIQAHPEDIQQHLKLARVYVSIRQFAKAIAVYEPMLDRVEDPARVLNNMGIACFLNGDIEAAVRHFRRAMDLKPDDERIERHLHKAQQILGQQERDELEPEPEIPAPGTGKAESREMDEDSFYWMD